MPVEARVLDPRRPGGGQAESVLAAHAVGARGELTPPLAALRAQPLEITVFEDSVGGIRGVREAAALLAAAGVSAGVAARGIADSAEKKAALQADGVEVWQDVNAAIAATL